MFSFYFLLYTFVYIYCNYIHKSFFPKYHISEYIYGISFNNNNDKNIEDNTNNTDNSEKRLTTVRTERNKVITKDEVWHAFTILTSTINSCVCLTLVFHNLINLYEMKNLEYVPDEFSTNILFYFCDYLFVDGMFMLFNFKISNTKYLFSTLLFLLHHFVGWAGIALIAYIEKGFFLGFYFCFTELSTLFLNLSCLYSHKNLSIFNSFYICFALCRLLTLPLLWSYIFYNFKTILNLPYLQYWFVMYGSILLSVLNLVWFTLINYKMQKMISKEVSITI